MSQVTVPLRQLLTKESQWEWGSEQEESFITLKAAITQAPVLGFYNPDKNITLSVDALSHCVGAVLLQEQHQKHMHLTH